MQEIRVAKIILQKNKVGEFTLHDFQTVIETAILTKGRDKDQWNRTESTKIGLYTYWPTGFSKIPR